MASRSLGTLTLDLVAKIGGFEAGMDKAARTADKKMSQIEKRAYAFGKALGGAMKIGAVAAVGGITLLAKQAIDAADEMRDLSIRLGTSTETLSAFSYAAKQTGTDMDSLAKGMKILAKNAADALNPTSAQAKVFDALGIKVTDSTGKLKDLGDLIPEIADKFQSLEDGTTKAALAQALFGKSGLNLTEFLNQGAAGLQKFADKARELGIIIDTETAAKADQFNDTLGDLKALVSGLGLQIASDLLPTLQQFADWLKQVASDGNTVAEAAKGIGATLSAVGDVIVFVGGYFTAFGNVIEGITEGVYGFIESAKGIINLDWDRIKNGMAVAQDGANLAYYGERQGAAKKQGMKVNFITGDSGSLPDSMKRHHGDAELARRLGTALSNPTAPHGGSKKKSGGKSDAEKEADQLKASYDRLIASQNEQIALFGKTGEAAKLRYELEFGELKNLDPALKANLMANAEKQDQQQAELDLQKQLDEMTTRREEAVSGVLQNLQSEIDLLGKTNEQRATYNALMQAGTDITAADRAAITAQVHALYQQGDAMAQQISIMDDFRQGASDALTAFVTGTKSAGDALKDFFNDLAARITQAIAEQWIKKLFGETGSADSGSAGGGWVSLIAGLFGGGSSSGFGGAGSPLAAGGPAMAGSFHLVNEHGPEMLSMGGRDYLMMGGQSGMVTPNHKLGSSGQVINNQFLMPAMVTRQTQEQVAQRVAISGNRATSRNR